MSLLAVFVFTETCLAPCGNQQSILAFSLPGPGLRAVPCWRFTDEETELDTEAVWLLPSHWDIVQAFPVQVSLLSPCSCSIILLASNQSIATRPVSYLCVRIAF